MLDQGHQLLVRGLHIAAHKTMYPKTWVEWQLVDDKVALENSNGGFSGTPRCSRRVYIDGLCFIVFN